MKRIVFFCVTALLVVTGFSLDARTSGRIVSGQVSHINSDNSSEGVQSEITFSTPGEASKTVSTDWDGTYMTSITSNKQYSCTASNEYGSQTKVLSRGSDQATLDFEF